jgi:nucleoside-diphosphate-sugar epimerase
VPWSSFGRAVADALGRRVRVLTLPAAAAWVAAAGSELVAHVSGRPAMLNVDKAREIAQGDWVCATERARDELGFSPTRTLREGVQATVDWYVEHGWLARRGAGPREEAA